MHEKLWTDDATTRIDREHAIHSQSVKTDANLWELGEIGSRVKTYY